MTIATGARSATALIFDTSDPGSGTVRAVVRWPRPEPSLADAIHLFEHFGLRVREHEPFRDGDTRAHRFEVVAPGAWDHRSADRVAAVFDAAAREVTVVDGFSRLAVVADVDWRGVALVRAATAFVRQAGLAMSQRYLVDTLCRHGRFVEALVAAFAARFDPDRPAPDAADRDAAAATARLAQHRAGADTLDEDRILRSLESFVAATVRTNWYQLDRHGHPKEYAAFMLDSGRLADPGPVVPHREIFVHAAHMQGIHARGGAVARGGLRFSDRPEDYRTEVLGLMKTQMVKNAPIVPVGAKGAFIRTDPDVTAAEAYSTFVRGMLDLADNIVDGRVVHPDRTVVYGGDDSYLVVAADKGTASFSDLANGIALERGFWLGDAFASGGSRGYDHKAMGITARGAWVAVREHFADLGVDVDTEPVTAVGIGDMSGDVFGNGMLLSPHLRLVGAFDHRHIFLDPDPDPARTHAERHRLFGTPGSSWDDFDREALSPGGGVWPRSAKSVTVSDEVRELLALPSASTTPDELIRALLTARVDLLWNGGVGTYVKASSEHHSAAADPRNDRVRVDASALRCRVVGEGGNLGFTQRARIEFAARGGRINADFIDNAAGVATSDAEVNIKIALDTAARAGTIGEAEHNGLLTAAQGEVAEAVLRTCRDQSVALGLVEARAAHLLGRHDRLIAYLESGEGLRRGTEVLPTVQELADRAGAGRGLTRPEIAVLLARSKNIVAGELLESDVPDDPVFAAAADGWFPDTIRRRIPDALRAHPLRREIAAARIAGNLVDHVGPGMIRHLEEHLGVRTPDVARAYEVVRTVFDVDRLWEAAGAAAGAPAQRWERLAEIQELVERATSWLLRTRPVPLDVTAEIGRLRTGVRELSDTCPGDLGMLGNALSVVDIARRAHRSPAAVARIHAAVGRVLGLDAVATVSARPGDRWDGAAVVTAREDLEDRRDALVAAILRHDAPAAGDPDEPDDTDTAVARWQARVPDAIGRVVRLTAELREIGTVDSAKACTVAAELRLLVRATDR